MYEIETKFEYTKKIKEALLQRASFIKKEVLEDTYFDTDTWELLSKDRWLRTRNSQWELKLPQHETGNINVRNVDNYHEIEGEEKILLALGIQKSLKHIFKPKISFTTVRETYQLEEFTLVFDESNFGHRVAEVELLVENPQQTKEAEQKIELFCKENGLVPHSVIGKCVAYMQIHYPDVLTMLIHHGIIRSFPNKK